MTVFLPSNKIFQGLLVRHMSSYIITYIKGISKIVTITELSAPSEHEQETQIGLMGRHPIVVVFRTCCPICNGMIVWLSGTRQRLPESLRPSPRLSFPVNSMPSVCLNASHASKFSNTFGCSCHKGEVYILL